MTRITKEWLRRRIEAESDGMEVEAGAPAGIAERIQKISVGKRDGQCDCCGADNVELSFSVAYGIETWSCAEGCAIEETKAERIAKSVLNAPSQRGWGNLDERERREAIAAVCAVLRSE